MKKLPFGKVKKVKKVSKTALKVGRPWTEDMKKKLSDKRKGQNNPNWHGESIKYRGLHLWVRSNLPGGKFCFDCGEKKPLDVANISGKYKRDLSDWEWLCRRCHMKKDGRLYKPRLPKNFKPKISTQKRKVDDAFGKIVRSLGYCELAGKDHIHCGGHLQTMHIITRSNMRLRWDKHNVLCGCAGHHVWYTHNPAAFNDFVSKNYPERWEYVMQHKNEIFKPNYEVLLHELRENNL